MLFTIQLSAYYPDKDYGGDRIYRDMLEQARCADRQGYESLAILTANCSGAGIIRILIR